MNVGELIRQAKEAVKIKIPFNEEEKIMWYDYDEDGNEIRVEEEDDDPEKYKLENYPSLLQIVKFNSSVHLEFR